jgi:UDP-glucuronate 4-epimerase
MAGTFITTEHILASFVRTGVSKIRQLGYALLCMMRDDDQQDHGKAQDNEHETMTMAMPPDSVEQPIIVTGAAGFIGFHVARALIEAGRAVAIIDNLSPYYDVALKEARLHALKQAASRPGAGTLEITIGDLADRAETSRWFGAHKGSPIIHLAAQAGVRYSIEAPLSYADANLTGFLTVLEAARQNACPHLVYASSSSVYGQSKDLPLREDQSTDHPVSLYAATKKANEAMAHSYAHLFALPVTGLRFFTVYGPWGRPDMAVYAFTKAAYEGSPIRLFNHGNLRRDFTYIDDIVAGVLGVLTHPPQRSEGQAPARILNIGNHNPTPLLELVAQIEAQTGRKIAQERVDMQPGDVYETYADISKIAALTGYQPQTDIQTGIAHFVSWYRSFYQV